MNSNHHHASKAPGHVARGVLRAALACALVLGAGLQAGAAWAQHGDRRDDQGPPQTQRSEHFRLPSMDRDARAYEDPRRSQQQPQQGQYQQQQQQQQPQYQPPSQQGRISGRMTPDERRDLRRQINEAGMDLYPQRR